MHLTKSHKDAIVRSILNDIPDTCEAQKVQAQTDLVKRMGKACRALYKINPNALATFYSRYSCMFDSHPPLVMGDADAQSVLAPYQEAKTKDHEMRARLHSAVHGCKTRKQFIDMFPEFSNYAPAEADRCSTLPAVADVVADVVADLVKAGWKQKVFKGVPE